MNNTDKLLRAFIEASGFEVKEVSREVTSRGCGSGGFWHKEELVVDDYRVTKKSPYVPITAQSKEWACVVGYLLAHDTDIETGVNDYGDLKPMLDFFNRNSTRASRSEWELGK